jgi:sulfate permease, SulP family
MQFATFHPRLLDSLRGYTRQALFKDVGAGITVGIVALPLALAFGIASGLSPQAGLWTAIVAGFLVSALGGSNIQIAGPAGAFIVVVYGIVERYGVANLLVSTAMAGALLFAMGWLRLGNLVRYVPVSLITGFTNGIAVLVALSQIKDALGLQVAKMPADFASLVATVLNTAHTFNPYALALTLLCVGGLALWPRMWAKDSALMLRLSVPGTHSALASAARIPAPVVAMLSLTVLAYALGLPVETIGSKFGGIPSQLPSLVWPSFAWDTVRHLAAPTLTLALLGAIESLLCARVGDQVAKTPAHDPNQELMAQGIANMVLPLLGGMPATGTIARTVTNARAGASTPIAGMVHALTLLGIVLLAAPLAMHIPLSVLAGVLLFVAWNMGEWREFARLKNYSMHYRLVMLSTFVLTVAVSLTVALQVGMALACVLFVRRMGKLFSVDAVAHNPQANVAHYSLRGVLFFGAVAKMDTVLQHLMAHPQVHCVQLDCSQLVALDTSGIDMLEQLHTALAARDGTLVLHGLPAQALSLVQRSGLAQRAILQT